MRAFRVVLQKHGFLGWKIRASVMQKFACHDFERILLATCNCKSECDGNLVRTNLFVLAAVEKGRMAY